MTVALAPEGLPKQDTARVAPKGPDRRNNSHRRLAGEFDEQGDRAIVGIEGRDIPKTPPDVKDAANEDDRGDRVHHGEPVLLNPSEIRSRAEAAEIAKAETEAARIAVETSSVTKPGETRDERAKVEIESLRVIANGPAITSEDIVIKVSAALVLREKDYADSQASRRKNTGSPTDRILSRGSGPEARTNVPKAVQKEHAGAYSKALKDAIRASGGDPEDPKEQQNPEIQRQALDRYYYGRAEEIITTDTKLAEKIKGKRSVKSKAKNLQEIATGNGNPLSEEEASKRAMVEYLEGEDRQGILKQLALMLGRIFFFTTVEQVLDLTK
jgi:hypothetical protein